MTKPKEYFLISVISWLLALAVLGLQNYYIFQQHYFLDSSFPWDFPTGYYGAVAFWTQAKQLGVRPDWLPFQAGGLPLHLMQQSFYGYLPFHVISWLKIDYTLAVATSLQCLHVWVASVGMLFLGRRFGLPLWLAVLAGIAYQAFGGFYCNAEHPDIVRGFAWLPWILYCLIMVDIDGSPLPVLWRTLLLPLFLYLFLTGAYPGQIISSFVLLSIWMAAQVFYRIDGSSNWSPLLYELSAIAAGVLIAALWSTEALAPPFLWRQELARHFETASMQMFAFELNQWPSIIVGNQYIKGEVSMTSCYVALPFSISAMLLPTGRYRTLWPHCVLGLLAAMLSLGKGTFLWPALTVLFPPAGLSRFASSDYRGFIAICIILLGAAFIRGIAVESLKPSISRCFIAGMIVLQACYLGVVSRAGLTDPLFTRTAVYALLTFFIIFVCTRRRLLVVALSLLGILVVIDASRTLIYRVPWDVRLSKGYAGNAYEDSGGLLIRHALINPPTARPERIDTPVGPAFYWAGFIRGDYLLSDFPRVLQSANLILRDSRVRNYFMREWCPAFWTVDDTKSLRQDITIPAEFHFETNCLANQVKQIRYSVSEIEYVFDIEETTLMIENEVYFPGWKLKTTTGHETEVIRVNGVMRGWLLEPGRYRGTASFTIPFAKVYAAANLLGVLLWACQFLVLHKMSSPNQAMVDQDQGRKT